MPAVTREAVDAPPSSPAGTSALPRDVLLVQSCQAHPAARHDFGELRDRDLVDLFCVLDALDARLGVRTTTARQERARKAVQIFIDEHGFFPSSSQYVDWRKESPSRRRALPSERSVRRAFGGSWEGVRASFGEGPGLPDLTAPRGIGLGPAFEKPELSAVFLTWMGTVAPDAELSRTALEKWLEAESEHPTTDLPRVPRTFTPFRRPDAFGSWAALLAEHGVAHRAAKGGAPRRLRPPQYRARLLDPVGPDHFGGNRARPRPAAGDTQLTAARELLAGLADAELWGDDRSCDNLRGVRACASLFGSLLSGPQYIAMRELAIEEAHSRGLDCDWPHQRQLTKRWGGWPQTKMAAGVMTAAEAESGSTRHRYGDLELEEYLLCALREQGLGLSDAGFSAWRLPHKRDRRKRGLQPRVPEASLIAGRLGDGNFDVAVDRVLDRHPQLRAELEERLSAPAAPARGRSAVA